MPPTVLSAQYQGAQVIAAVPVERRAPGPGQVEIAPAYTGICGTDLHVLHGDMDRRVTPPAVIGHETAGYVVEVGEGVEGWSPGDAVTVVPLAADGTCPACRAGNGHVCEHLDFLGIDSTGALAERWVVPAEALLRLPDGLDIRTAALLEPTAVAVHDVRRARVAAGEAVLVVGGGPVGLLIALVARQAGAAVTVVEPDAARRAAAEAVGLAVLDPTSEDVTAAVLDRTDGAGAAVAFEVSGTQPGLDTAVAALAVRGRVCQVGIHAAPRTIDVHRFFWRELELLGARLYTRADWQEAVDLVAGGTLPVEGLISRVVPLAEVADAFAALAGGGGVVKVLVDCGGATERSA
ncbi:2-desacetyl-2-hydroxyethyl bacteriochlorophyllide A dehydrogenase [Motilibacter rhizosphaerae]|uniref:2-desacetyl-2-hydroxyethyl bacteriochlorophyllide A dehydrogenase n=1 Tax=Motilibacter rhizosphaerae TaxID=598652 RepID=A0A4Q7NXM2_9ACTN|nr:alcohol dehydrogenase catalytic domain-containing protein [Motilibacter rhizosphaerae]RZS91658.1 2-desacetyl-2-hydroxyethyl bacteriochlorophyllide A dehydrogenase [Motilibacter rhizosphaerae]